MMEPMEISVDRYRSVQTEDYAGDEPNVDLYGRPYASENGWGQTLKLVLLIAVVLLGVSFLTVQNQADDGAPDFLGNNNNYIPTAPHSNENLQMVVDALQENYWDAAHGSWRGDGDDLIDENRGTTDSGMIGWWNAANTLLVLVLAKYMDLVNTPPIKEAAWEDLESVLDTVYEKQNITGIVQSMSYDAMAWVGLSWIQVYKAYAKQDSLQRAKDMWRSIQRQAWTSANEECGGGFYWAGEHDITGEVDDEIRLYYKNAITNSLFVMLSMELYFLEDHPKKKAEYLEWAKRTWQWIHHSELIQTVEQPSLPSDSPFWGITQLRICDGLELENANGKCGCNDQDAYTYNQGVMIGAIGLLHKAFMIEENSANSTKADATDKNDSAFSMETLQQVATGLIADVLHSNLDGNIWLDQDAILQEECPMEACEGYDQQQFKGIFVRYLRMYLDVVGDAIPPRIQDEIRTFLSRQANAVWNQVDNSNIDSPPAGPFIGFQWDLWCAGSSELDARIVTAVTQTSGLDALLAGNGLD